MAEQILFIVNRKAGTDHKQAFPEAVARFLDTAHFSYRIVYTEFRGHGVDLAREAARNGVAMVVAVGGDGSVNEAARGLVNTDTVLAIIPRGSGNGLARFLHIPRDIRGALEVINRGVPRSIDVGFANGHLFLSNAGVGFDTLIATLFSENKGRGLFNYARLVLTAIFRYRPVTYRLRTETGEWHHRAFFVTAANANQFGYGFQIAPQAKIDDGFLDICIMGPLHWWQLAAVSLRALAGKLPGSRYAGYLHCQSVVIAAGEPISALQVDGDAVPVEKGEVVIEVRQKALRVLVPQRMATALK